MNENPSNIAMFVILIVILLAIGVAFWFYRQRERTKQLRSKFGPEYDKVVSQHHDRGRAELELERRAQRVSKFKIEPLDAETRAKFSQEWRNEQSRFVDDPRTAVRNAHALVQDVMHRRGYPIGNFEQNAADLSVDHPKVVENYRVANDIALREKQGLANTEDLRKAMVSYRSLFEELLLEVKMNPQEIRR